MLPEQLDADGFASVAGILTYEECTAITDQIAALDCASAGTRCLLEQMWCRDLAQRLQQHPAIATVIPADFAAVQCTYFEKSVERNWLVPIHQDLSIPVAARVEHDAVRGWSEKEGNLFVQPPAELLEQLIAIRIHLDPCLQEDGPLQFLAGTHRYGRIGADEARQRREAGALVSCTMGRGDALLMRPLVLHASSKADGSSKRRVLHFVFGPQKLPYGLAWPRPHDAPS